MRKSNVITAILATADTVWVAPAHAVEVTPDDHLPAVAIGIGACHMITVCLNGAGRDGFAMDMATAIETAYGCGEENLINPTY